MLSDSSEFFLHESILFSLGTRKSYSMTTHPNTTNFKFENSPNHFYVLLKKAKMPIENISGN